MKADLDKSKREVEQLIKHHDRLISLVKNSCSYRMVGSMLLTGLMQQKPL